MNAHNSPPATVGPAAPTRPLRVLHVFRILDRELIGGLYTYLESVAQALDGSNIETHVASLLYGEKPACVHACAWAEPKGGSRLFSAVRFARWLRGAVRDYDVVHIHGVDWTLLFAAPICVARGVPFVVSPHATLIDWRIKQTKRFWHWYRRVYGRRLLRKAAAIVSTTELDARANKAFEPALDPVIIPPGFAVPDAPRTQQRAADARALEVVFVGRLQPLKGLPPVLEAVAKIHRRGDGVRLHLLGSGPADYEAGLRAQAQRLGITDALVWHGYIDGQDKDRLTSAADVFVLNSQGENYSFATAEALALGVPVVLSEGVGLADAARRHNAGTIVPINDADALAAALWSYSDPQRRAEHGRNAHRCAREELGFSRMRQSLERTYCDAIGRT